MKAFHLSTKAAAFLAMATWLFACSPAALAQTGQIAARPLTPQEIHDLELPEGTRVSAGLFTVGVGSPVYLEAQVSSGTTVSNVTWAVTSRPTGSTAGLEASPLDPSVPIYNPGDREIFEVAGRQLFVPDREGQYTVQATVTTDEGDLILSRVITAGTYVQYSTCASCHNGGWLPDKVTPWSQTGHASFFTEAIDGLKSSHYNEECIQCHTLGYDPNPAATNRGFDDIAMEVGWTFPSVLEPGNWDAMTNVLKGAANIQCENCHGPGSQHAGFFGNPNYISVSFSSGDCAQCHDDQPYHVKNQEWNNSRHAIATRYPTGENRESCVICHSGIGFIDRVDMAELRTDYEAITCAACHDPHVAENPHQIRTLADVALMDNITVITNGGKGKLCMNCHISRREAISYVEGSGIPASSRFGPHHGPQTDMLAGVNAYTFGKVIPGGNHLQAVGDTCVTCHLQATGLNDPGHLQVGGHTFRPAWDGGTPENPSDDVHLVGACMQCHGPITSFNFERQDYDGDGEIEGVQTEIEGLLHDLAMMLAPIGEPTVDTTLQTTQIQLGAAYNYLFIEEDGSKGIHNLHYAVNLLKESMAQVALEDDSDLDGLSDEWEIVHFDSIEAYDGTGDPDVDMVNNALELVEGTDPNEVDTDNDGYSDQAELLAGTDPLDPDDYPEFRLYFYTGSEFEFATQEGTTYQVQKVSVGQESWVNVGEPIEGTGEPYSFVVSDRTEHEEYYRVVEVSQNSAR